MPSAYAVALRRPRWQVRTVVRELMMSASKLSRLENAQGKPIPPDIRDLIRYYEIEGTPLAARLERRVKPARRPGWWTNCDDEVTRSRSSRHSRTRHYALMRLTHRGGVQEPHQQDP